MASGLPAKREGRQSLLCSSIGVWVYGLVKYSGFRSLIRRVILRMEGGAMYSLSVREIFRRYHDLDVGLYTIGPCEAGPEGFDPGVAIGRYSSVYYTVRALTKEHEGERKFEVGIVRDTEPRCGSKGEAKQPPSLVIGNDVFIGHNAIILPSVKEIGDGAFIGAGTVVKCAVPAYAVVMGNPGRVVRYRFSKEKIRELMEEKWWLRCLDDLEVELAEFRRPLDDKPAH